MGLDWQEIETLPEDVGFGEKILVWNPCDGASLMWDMSPQFLYLREFWPYTHWARYEGPDNQPEKE